MLEWWRGEGGLWAMVTILGLTVGYLLAQIIRWVVTG